VVHDILEIDYEMLAIPLMWEHVKGHQDDTKKWYKLRWMESLNIQAYKNASISLNTALQMPVHTISMIPFSKVSLQVKLMDLTSHYDMHLHNAATQPAMLQHTRKTKAGSPHSLR
jgi:hypothetical protein